MGKTIMDTRISNRICACDAIINGGYVTRVLHKNAEYLSRCISYSLHVMRYGQHESSMTDRYICEQVPTSFEVGERRVTFDRL